MSYEYAVAVIVLLPVYVSILSGFAYVGKVMAMRILYRRGDQSVNGQETE